LSLPSDDLSKVNDLNRIQQHVQQLEQQGVCHSNDMTLDPQSRLSASSDVSSGSGYIGPSNNPVMRLLLEAGQPHKNARAAYSTDIGMATMHGPRLSLEAVTAAASLVHECASVRKGRVDALVVVDLCSPVSSTHSSVQAESTSLACQARCLQVTAHSRRFSYWLTAYCRHLSALEFWPGSLNVPPRADLEQASGLYPYCLQLQQLLKGICSCSGVDDIFGDKQDQPVRKKSNAQAN
jgi:hypothetical protein